MEMFMENKKIIIGSDHAGFNLKNIIINYLKEQKYEIKDIGCYSVESVDYPIIAKDLSMQIADGTFARGILICGTGVGMSIAANKIKGIRAVVCSDTTSAKYARLHNDTNVLCLGARIIGEYLAKDICATWLNTEFEANRHIKRINLLEN